MAWGHRLSSLHFGCGWSGLGLVTVLVLGQSPGAEPLAACTVNHSCLWLCQSSTFSICPSVVLCVLQVSAHRRETALAASLNVPSPKGRNVLCRIQQELGITESLLSAETPSDQPPVPAEGKHKGGNRPNSEGNNFVLLHFLFLEALSCLCTLPGIGDLLLEAGFLQPESLHSHFHSVLLCCDSSVGQSNASCMQGYSSSYWKGNQPCFPQYQHATPSFPLAEPFSLSQLCPGLVSGSVWAGEVLITQS